MIFFWDDYDCFFFGGRGFCKNGFFEDFLGITIKIPSYKRSFCFFLKQWFAGNDDWKVASRRWVFNLAGVRWRIGTLTTLTRPIAEKSDQLNLILSFGSLMRFSPIKKRRKWQVHSVNLLLSFSTLWPQRWYMEMSPLSFSDRTYWFASTEVGLNDILLQIPIEIMGFQLTTQNDFDLEKWLPSSKTVAFIEGFYSLESPMSSSWWSLNHGDPAVLGFQVSGGGPFEGLVFCGKLCDGTRSFDPGNFLGLFFFYSELYTYRSRVCIGWSYNELQIWGVS